MPTCKGGGILRTVSHRPDGTRAQAVADALQLIREGHSLRTAGAVLGLDFRTLAGWLTGDAETERAYRLAQTERAAALAEESVAISDGTDVLSDAYRVEVERMVEEADPKIRNALARSLESARVQRDKLRVDTRKWFAARLDPKRFGDKVDVTTGGQALPGAVVLPAEAWGAAIAAGAAAGAGAVLGAIAAGAHNRIEGEPGAGALIAPAPAVTSGGVG